MVSTITTERPVHVLGLVETKALSLESRVSIKLSSLCFNLSARERNRLRPIRRMPHIISRELMKKKVALERLSVDSGVESELSAEAEIGAFIFMTESNDLWRVVASFL